MRIGVLSDTYGKLRPRVLELLAGCDRLLHAGDVGGPEILKALATIAPVAAVRGNWDTEGAAAKLPETLTGELGGLAGRPGLPFGMVHRKEDVPRRTCHPSGRSVCGSSCSATPTGRRSPGVAIA